MTQAIVEAILDLENRRLTGMRTRDLAMLEQVFDDDLMFVHTTGKADSKAGMLAFAASGSDRTYKLGSVEVTSEGDMACLYGDIFMTVTLQDKPPMEVHMFVTRLARKRDGVWRYVLVQTTAISA